MAGITVDFNAQISRFTSSIDKMTNDLNKFQSHSSRVSANISKAFSALGVGISVAGLTAIVKSSIDAADSLNDMSQRLGVSVKDLASFRLAAEQSGTSLEGVGAGIARLTRSIGDAETGNKQIAASLKTLGISARDPKEAFFQLADAVQRIQDPAQRATLLNDVLGKSYQDLIPLLNEGGDSLRKMAKDTESFADTMARLAPDADKFNDQMAALKLNSTEAASSIVADLLPGLNKITEAMREAAKEGGFLEAMLVGLGGAMTGIFTNDLLEREQQINKELKNLTDLLKEPTLGDLINPMKGFDAMMSGGEGAIKKRIGNLQSELDEIKKIRSAEKDRSDSLKRFKEIEGGTFQQTAKHADDSLRKFRELQKFMDQEGGFEPLQAEENFFEEVNDAASKNQKEFNDRWLKEQEDALDKTNEELRQSALEAQQILFDVDPIARATHEWEKLTKLVEKDLLSQENAGKKFKKEFGDDLDQMGIYAKRFADNVQRSLGDVLYDGLNGNFDNIGDAFKQMLLRMAADAAAAQLTQKMFGNMATTGEAGGWVGNLLNIAATIGGGGGGGNVATFEGGGYTGYGSRTGGVDGKGGFRAILHPNETVIDHVKGGRSGASINYAPVINIDSRTDRAEVQRLVSGAVKQGNAELVDRLQRAGALA